MLVTLDGADTPLLHALDVASPDEVSTGMRVQVRWAEERVGAITDIACFEPLDESGFETVAGAPSSTTEGSVVEERGTSVSKPLDQETSPA